MHVPYLVGSGDLGVSLLLLLEQLDRLTAVQPCSCVASGRADNADAASHHDRRDVFASLCSVLAACGQVGAVDVVRRYSLLVLNSPDGTPP